MTYLRFHLLFNLPATLLLAVATWGRWSGAEGLAAAGVLLAVLLFTSPWDNAAVRRGIWDFPADRILGRISWLPLEDYLFFLWQSVNVIASLKWALMAFPALHSGKTTPLGPANYAALGGVFVVWLAAGFWLKRAQLSPRWNYTRHLFYWFLPLIVFQWALAPGLFLALLPLLGGAALAWGTYYAVADLVAVREGVWYFDSAQITGWKLGGILPWEEIAFFYLTSLVVAQSYVLLLPAALR